MARPRLRRRARSTRPQTKLTFLTWPSLGPIFGDLGKVRVKFDQGLASNVNGSHVRRRLSEKPWRPSPFVGCADELVPLVPGQSLCFKFGRVSDQSANLPKSRPSSTKVGRNRASPWRIRPISGEFGRAQVACAEVRLNLSPVKMCVLGSDAEKLVGRALRPNIASPAPPETSHPPLPRNLGLSPDQSSQTDAGHVAVLGGDEQVGKERAQCDHSADTPFALRKQARFVAPSRARYRSSAAHRRQDTVGCVCAPHDPAHAGGHGAESSDGPCARAPAQPHVPGSRPCAACCTEMQVRGASAPTGHTFLGKRRWDEALRKQARPSNKVNRLGRAKFNLLQTMSTSFVPPCCVFWGQIGLLLGGQSRSMF